jgi:hypothetical protein
MFVGGAILLSNIASGLGQGFSSFPGINAGQPLSTSLTWSPSTTNQYSTGDISLFKPDKRTEAADNAYGPAWAGSVNISADGIQ